MNRRRSSRTVAFIAWFTAIGFALTACDPTAVRPPAGGTVVSEKGADVTMSGARIVVPSGAAPAGTKVDASIEGSPPGGSDGAKLKPLAKPLKIKLGDGVQPSKPLTVTIQVDRSQLVGEQAQNTGGTVAMMVQSDGAENPDIVPATWDQNAGTITAQVPHLSMIWPVQLDLAGFVNGARDSLNELWNIQSPKPDCADKPLTIGGTTYTPVSPPAAWLCLRQANGSLVVSAAPNSPVPFLVSSLPAATAGNEVDLSVPALASLHLAQLLALTKSGNAVLMPGATATFTLSPPTSNVAVHFDQYYVMLFVSVLMKTLELIASIVKTPRTTIKALLDAVGKAKCLQAAVQTAQAGSIQQMSTGLLKSFFDCAVTVAGAEFTAAVDTFKFKAFQVVLALLTAAPEAVAGLVLVAADGIMQRFGIAPAASFNAMVVASAPAVAKPPARSGNFSTTLTGGATMAGPSSHVLNVGMNVPEGWVVLPDRGFYNDEVKVANAKDGELRLDLLFRDDGLEGACAPFTYKLLEDDRVTLSGIDPAPANTHAAILSELFANGQYTQHDFDYPFMLYVVMAGNAPNTPGPLGQDCPGRAHFRVGSVFGLMGQSLGFNSEQEVKDFMSGPNFRKLKETMASLKVALIK